LTVPALDLGVLVSGSGTNLQAILDAVAGRHLDARVRVVLSSKEGVLALERARRAGVPAHAVVPAPDETREAYDARLLEVLSAHDVRWVALAGFMRLLGPTFLSAFPGRVVNIHPALLPSFPGTHAPRRALEHGVKLAGCTVHLVDEGVDTGPIIAQAAVPVLEDDTESTLHARIQAVEHRLYPAALQALAEGRVRVIGRRVSVEGARADGLLASLEV
jgi:phosphoribosylglycinamide formyltransferase-1